MSLIFNMFLISYHQEDTLLTVLGLAHQYVFKELQTAISEYLMAILSIRSVCDIYDLAFMYDLKSLCETCCDYMDRNAEDILQHEGFYQLSPVKFIATGGYFVIKSLSKP